MSLLLLDIIQEMEEKYDIDTETGIITRKRTGKIMGCKNTGGYIIFSFNHVNYYVHRIILTKYLEREIKPDYKADHINHNKSDNRISNLRELNHQENTQHQQLSSRNTSGYKGVSWNKPANKWIAHVMLNKKRIHLGLFDTKEDAYSAYKKKATELNKLGHKYFIV